MAVIGPTAKQLLGRLASLRKEYYTLAETLGLTVGDLKRKTEKLSRWIEREEDLSEKYNSTILRLLEYCSELPEDSEELWAIDKELTYVPGRLGAYR